MFVSRSESTLPGRDVDDLAMKAVMQRVAHASVTSDGVTVGNVGHGSCVLVAVICDDNDEDAVAPPQKVLGLRLRSASSVPDGPRGTGRAG